MTLRQQSGVTLIENLVTTLVLMVVLALASSLFAFGTRVFSRETTSVALQADLAGAKNMLLDDLSIAGYRPTELLANGPYPPSGSTTVLPTSDIIDVVNPGGSASLTVFDDLDFLGDVDSNEDTDRVCYRLASGELRRRVVDDPTLACSSGTEELLLSNVAALNVQILDATRAVLTKAQVEAGSPAPRFAQVTVAVQNNVKGGSVWREARGETAIRN